MTEAERLARDLLTVMERVPEASQDYILAAIKTIRSQESEIESLKAAFMASLAKVCTAYGKPGECIYIQMRHAQGETK